MANTKAQALPLALAPRPQANQSENICLSIFCVELSKHIKPSLSLLAINVPSLRDAS